MSRAVTAMLEEPRTTEVDTPLTCSRVRKACQFLMTGLERTTCCWLVWDCQSICTKICLHVSES